MLIEPRGTGSPLNASPVEEDQCERERDAEEADHQPKEEERADVHACPFVGFRPSLGERSWLEERLQEAVDRPQDLGHR
jgi:hypothetical protein